MALGVDYTIFLVTRAREETPQYGTRLGIVRAVLATGAVITSAGIVLAAVFCVLGVLPLIVLTQLGIIISLGILLDLFVVRTVVIPALFTLIGPRIGGPPSSTSQQQDADHQNPTGEYQCQPHADVAGDQQHNREKVAHDRRPRGISAVRNQTVANDIMNTEAIRSA